MLRTKKASKGKAARKKPPKKKLTAEQRRDREMAALEFIRSGPIEDPAEREQAEREAEEGIRGLYKGAGEAAVPEVFWTDGPLTAGAAADVVAEAPESADLAKLRKDMEKAVRETQAAIDDGSLLADPARYRGLGQALYPIFHAGRSEALWIERMLMQIEEGGELDDAHMESLGFHRKILRGASWIRGFSRIAIACRPPLENHVDLDLQISNENGPAALWIDGSSAWAINGVMLTRQIVMEPETMTRKQIESEQNADVRAIMMERFGYKRYIDESDAKLVHYDEDQFGRPMCLLDVGDEGVYLLVCTDGSTQHVFHCPVPRSFRPDRSSEEEVKMETCGQAEAWLAGIDNYNRIISAS